MTYQHTRLGVLTALAFVAAAVAWLVLMLDDAALPDGPIRPARGSPPANERAVESSVSVVGSSTRTMATSSVIGIDIEVVDSEGLPVADVMVVAHMRRARAIPRSIAPLALTDPGGRAFVEARALGLDAASDDIDHEGRAADTRQSLYCIHAGYATAEIEGPLPGSSYQVVLSAANAFTVHCATRAGDPLPDAEVTMTRATFLSGANGTAADMAMSVWPGPGNAGLHVATSDVTGAATFDSLPAGKYLVVARHVDYACVALAPERENMPLQILVPGEPAEMTFVPIGAAVWRPASDRAIVANFAACEPACDLTGTGTYLPNAALLDARRRLEHAHPGWNVHIETVASWPTRVTRDVFAPGKGRGKLTYVLAAPTRVAPSTAPVEVEGGPLDPGKIRVVLTDPALRNQCALLALVDSSGRFRLLLDGREELDVPPGKWHLGSPDWCVNELARSVVPVDVVAGSYRDMVVSSPVPLGVVRILVDAGSVRGHYDVTVRKEGRVVNRRAFADASVDLVVPLGALDVSLHAYGFAAVREQVDCRSNEQPTIWRPRLTVR